MRVRNITVGIKSLRESLTEFGETVEAISRGEAVVKNEGVFFESLEAMRQVLTPKRLELLQVIRKKMPDSIYELAQITKRDLKNVQDDVGLLSRMGLISLTRAKTAKKRLIPRVGYDQLRLQIPMI